MSNFSKYFSLSKAERFAKTLGIGRSKKTPSNYLKYVENAFFLHTVEIFLYSIKDQLQYPRKVYCVDTHLINALTSKFSENLDRLMENVVFLELLRQKERNPIEIYYWKDYSGKEVDFVLMEGRKIKQLVQVFHVSAAANDPRETKALVKASKELKCRSPTDYLGFRRSGRIQEQETEVYSLWECFLPIIIQIKAIKKIINVSALIIRE